MAEVGGAAEPGMGGSNPEPPPGSPGSVHPPTLEAQTPWLITQMMSFLISLVSNFGWPLLLLGVLCGVLWNKYGPEYRKYRRRVQDQKDAEIMHKNPDIFLAREAAVEQARLRLQERYNSASADHRQKEEEREQQRRLAKLEAQEAQLRGESTGRRLNSAAPVPTPEPVSREKKKPLLRPAYNPLLGNSGADRYRPTRRGGAAGGG